MDLNGKNVVFVAGFGGIGYEACKQLMTRNVANLIILDVMENPKALKTLQDINGKTKLAYIKCDVTDKQSIKNTIDLVVKTVKYIDVLVNGAGVIADRNIEFTINVNLIGLINTTMEALPYMDKTQKGRGGVILNIASVLGLEPCPPIAVYSASKFGVVGFTRSLADPYYYNRSGVAVTAICPGLTESPMTANPKISDTFEYSKPLTDEIFAAPRQPAAKAGEHLVKIIELAQNGALWISDRSTMKLVEPKHTLTGHSGKVMAAKYIQEPVKVVTGSHDRTLKVWDLRSIACIETKFAGSSCNDLVTTDSLGSTIISGHYDKKIRFWDIRTEKQADDVLMNAKITSLDLSKDCNYLICSVRDDTIKLLDLRKNQVISTFSNEHFKLSCDWARASFNMNATKIACGSADGVIYIWNVMGNLESELKGHASGSGLFHSSAVNAVSWSPTCNALASVGKGKKCLVYTES